MAELPPDQNNNPHLRAQLKRDRDATERFQASQQEMSAKAARIQSQARQRHTPEPETKTRLYTDDSARYGPWDPGFEMVPGGDRLRTRDMRIVTNAITAEEVITWRYPGGPAKFWGTTLE